MKKQLHKMKKKTIQVLLYISEDSFEFAQSPFFSCLKIALFFFQLQGYVFSQYEIKPLFLPENNYIANYTQLSAFTFTLLQYGNDQLSQICFYASFLLHLSVYVTLLLLSLKTNLEQPSVIKKLLNLFFINYQWIFVTPFQEISVGIMVCGGNSFLRELQYDPSCAEQKNKLLYIVGVLATLFITISGFMISYFFRNYQFYGKTFSRQFNYINVLRIIMHQFIIILYYINLTNIHYIKHALQHILSLSLILDLLVNKPFGYSIESKFYSAAVVANQLMLCMVSYWIFGTSNDKFMFYTFLLMLPLLFTLFIQLKNIEQIQIYSSFNPNKFNMNTDIYLEEIYRTAEDNEVNIQCRIEFIQIITDHIFKCNNSQCYCNKDITRFINSEGINQIYLDKWTSYIFERSLVQALIENEYDYYEHLALKYVTFLAKYRKNPVNAFAILQQIMHDQQFSNKTTGRSKQLTASFYFSHIQAILIRRNKQQFQITHNKKSSSAHEQIVLQSQTIVKNVGSKFQQKLYQLAKLQYQFWNAYANSKITNFQEIYDACQEIYDNTIQCREFLNWIKQKQAKQFISVFDSISIIRLQILFELISSNNLKPIISLFNQTIQIQLMEQSESDTFQNYYFLKRQSISIVINIARGNRGMLMQNQNIKEIKEFFLVQNDITNINEVIPKPLGIIHNGLIENYFQRGQTNRSNDNFDTFALSENGMLQPLSINLGSFFPKFEKDYQFYMIGHIKKKYTNQDEVDASNNMVGYCILDAQLNVIGCTQNVANQILNTKEQLDCSKLDITYFIPNLLDSIISYYELLELRMDTRLIDNEIVAYRCQDQIQCNGPNKWNQVKNFNNKHLDVKGRLKYLHNLKIILEETDRSPQQQVPRIPVHYTITQKYIEYFQDNQTQHMLYYVVKIEFSEFQIETKQKVKITKEPKQLKTFQIESMGNNQFEDRASQRSKSSGLTIFTIADQFYSQIGNAKSIKKFIVFTGLNAIYILLMVLVTLLFLLLFSMLQANQQVCLNAMNFNSQFITSYSELLNSLRHWNFVNLSGFDGTISQNNQSLILNSNQMQTLTSLLVNQSIQDVLSLNQNYELDVLLSGEFQLKLFTDSNLDLKTQNINSAFIVKQVLDSTLNNIQSILTLHPNISEMIKDLSIVQLNYHTFMNLSNNTVIGCFEEQNNQLQAINNQALYTFIILYIAIFVIMLGQLYTFNMLHSIRKQLLQLFTRTDPAEASQEAEKHNGLLNLLKQSDIWFYDKFNYEFSIDNITSRQIETKEDLTRKRTKVGESARSRFIGSRISQNLSKAYSILTIMLLAIVLIIFMIIFNIQFNQISEEMQATINIHHDIFTQQINYLYAVDKADTLLYQQYYQTTLEADPKQQFIDYQMLALLYETADYSKIEYGFLNAQLGAAMFQDILYQNSQNQKILSQLTSQYSLLQDDLCSINQMICEISINSQMRPYWSSLYTSFANVSISDLQQISSQNFILNQEYYLLQDSEEIIKAFKKVLNSSNYLLNQIWGYDIIIRKLNKFTIHLDELINGLLDNKITSLRTVLLAIGIMLLIIQIVLIIVFSMHIIIIQTRTRKVLQFIPFNTISNKNIYTQLKNIK